MELVYYPDPVLRKRAQPLSEIDGEVRRRASEMFRIMYAEGGVGLAAPQVAWTARLFVMNAAGEADPGGERVYVNPEIVLAEGEILDEEGCLSVPGVRGKVRRSARVVVRALDLEGKSFEAELSGIEARAAQHEIDHLDGILFVTRLGTSDRLLARKELRRLEDTFRSRSAERASRQSGR
ncbi:MAG: peptide deformylase [Planctomycetota bacterium]